MAFRHLMALLLAALSAVAPAMAQSARPSSLRADPFSALVGKRQSAAEREAASAAVERYIVATDDRVFLFQSDAREGRIKFLCGDGDSRIDCIIDEETPAEEIHQLLQVRASRGDVTWNDRRGETMLRVAAYGGVTVFWPGDARGLAASKSFSEDPSLVLPFASIATAQKRAHAATAIISARVGAPITFNIGDPQPDAAGGAAVLADAVVRAASGVAKVAEDPTGARVIAARIRRVDFVAGQPKVGLQKGVLNVEYNPMLDVEGRPSSAAIAKFLEDSL
jgi:hypothetical protein